MSSVFEREFGFRYDGAAGGSLFIFAMRPSLFPKAFVPEGTARGCTGTLGDYSFVVIVIVILHNPDSDSTICIS